MTGKLILLPNLLDDTLENHAPFLPANIGDTINALQGVICETEKPARRFLGRFKKAQLPLKVLNEHTKNEEVKELLAPIEKGEVWGLLSDAGLPCIADPGSLLVALARKKNIPVEAVVGPSSLFMALMLSGLSGQNFSFNGYLPRERDPRKSAISKLEQKSKKGGSTEIFIEAPYRNQEMLKDLIETLQPGTLLSISCDLTAPTQEVYTKSVKEWRGGALPTIHKRPTIFLIYAM